MHDEELAGFVDDNKVGASVNRWVNEILIVIPIARVVTE